MADKVMRPTPEPGSPALGAHPLTALRDEVDRLFDSFFPPAFGRSLLDCGGFDPARSFAADGGRAFAAVSEAMPGVEVRECGDHYEIAVELPGLDENDVTVTVRNDLLTIAGEKRVGHGRDKADVRLSERFYGAFSRAFRLPEDADPDAVAADFAKGVLTVTAAKRGKTGAGEKKVEIKGH